MAYKIKTKKDKEAINNSIAHLNGYALVVKSRTGYKPFAVEEAIRGLKRIRKKK
jgi:hypothetical protein